MTKITVPELKAAAELLLSHLERHSASEIEIKDDFYWDVPEPKRYDKYEEPKQFDVGQLSDDVNELRRIATGAASPAGYGLVWLAAVLRRIGETSKF